MRLDKYGFLAWQQQETGNLPSQTSETLHYPWIPSLAWQQQETGNLPSQILNQNFY